MRSPRKSAGMKTDAFEGLIPCEIVERMQAARGMPAEDYFTMAARDPLFGGTPA